MAVLGGYTSLENKVNDTTIYYTVTFDSNGGTQIDPVIVPFEGALEKPNDPLKEGFVFIDWFKDNETFVEAFMFGNNGEKISHDITLFAKWEKTEITEIVSQDKIGIETETKSDSTSDTNINKNTNTDTNTNKNSSSSSDIETTETKIVISKDEVQTENNNEPSNPASYTVIFDSDDNKIESSVDYDSLIAEYLAGEIVIGYAVGDNPKYVTQKLTLPTKINSADISWASSSNAILTDGTVTRQTTDTDVTLTATAIYNGKTAERTFNLKVIKARTRVYSEIATKTIAQASSGDIFITRNGSGDITDIEGNYSEFNIDNADDALDAITVIKNELGVKSPDKELEIFNVTSDKYGAEYQFQQVYKGVKVYGRGLMSSANSKGEGDFLHSNLISSDVVSKADGKADIGKTSAENNAKSVYTGDITFDSANTEKVIYSFDDYENNPVYVYIVRIYGTDGDGKYVDESVFVNAETGDIIFTASNSLNMVEAHGKDEKGDDVEFEVYPLINLTTNIITYYLHDPDIPLYVCEGIADTKNVVNNTNNVWNENGKAVSAYCSMVSVMKWWKEAFGRNAIDDKGRSIYVVINPNKTQFAPPPDNAAFNYFYEQIYISNPEKHDYSFAVTPDVLAHESGHAVLHFDAGIEGTKKMSGAITEGYSDVFACLYNYSRYYSQYGDTNAIWQLGRGIYKNSTTIVRLFYKDNDTMIKNISEYDKKGDTHKNGTLLPRSAYLMRQNGLGWKELGNVWYKSVRMGLNEGSDFYDVRRCVLTAAQKIGLPYNKIAIIENAFNEVGISNNKFIKLSGTVTSNGKPLSGVKVIVSKKNYATYEMIAQITTTDIGRYVLNIEEGDYYVMFMKDGYESKIINQTITAGSNVELNAELSLIGAVSINATNFPDENFRNFIKNKYDLDKDGILSSQEIGRVGAVGISGNTISSLKGIEHFKNMKNLFCDNCGLKELDVSKCTALTILVCNDNQLTTLDVSKLTALETLRCHNNQLTNLDITKNTALKILECDNNSLTELDLTHNPKLEQLKCNNNQLTSLDFSKCPEFYGLFCIGNQIQSLNLANCKLGWVRCENNNLTVLDLSKCLFTDKFDKNNDVSCDSTVTVTWPSTISSSAIPQNFSYPATSDTSKTSSTVNKNKNLLVIATIPDFIPSRTGEYSFDVSLDRTLPKFTDLILLNLSEDLNGVFTKIPASESFDRVNVSANFEQGKKYSPVIAAEVGNENINSGGCNSGIFCSVGILILLAGFVIVKKLIITTKLFFGVIEI